MIRKRHYIPHRVTLSEHDRASELKLSRNNLCIRGFEGYRIARATHSVSRGTWYFEAKITWCPEDSDACVRIGWCQASAPLECTLGFEKVSYGVRSKKGTKFHNSCGYTYYRPGFKVNDIIGVLIHLPQDNNLPFSSYLASSKKKCTIGAPEYRHFKESMHYSEDCIKLKPEAIVPGSRIEYFVNGKSCGIAFEDIYRGFYFPAVALYGYETFPEVQFNFGPNLQFLPDYAKPMSKRAEELIPEIVVNEMLDFLEATNNNNL